MSFICNCTKQIKVWEKQNLFFIMVNYYIYCLLTIDVNIFSGYPLRLLLFQFELVLRTSSLYTEGKISIERANIFTLNIFNGAIDVKFSDVM